MTFDIARTQYFAPFRVKEMPSGKFRVHRFNRLTNQIEKWDREDLATRSEAERTCGFANSALAEREDNLTTPQQAVS